MIPVFSSWLGAHGKLWYDDRYYRLAWIIWPQALAAVLMLFFWAMPPSVKNAPWAKPVDRKSTRLNSSHLKLSRMPSSA